MKVPVDKIGEVIGPKGKVINQIQDDTGAQITHRGRRHDLRRRHQRRVRRGGPLDHQRDRQPDDARGRRALPRHRRQDDQLRGVRLAAARQGRPAAHQQAALAWPAASASRPSRTSSRSARRSRSRSARSTTAASSRSSRSSRSPSRRRRGRVTRRSPAEYRLGPLGPASDAEARHDPHPAVRQGRGSTGATHRAPRRAAGRDRGDARRPVRLGRGVGRGRVARRDARPVRVPRTSSSTCCSRARRPRSALDISVALDEVGGEFNAFTAKEYTCFHARVLDEDLPLAVDVLGDMVTSSTLTAEDVEAEREVILDEIAMHDDDPDDVVGNLYAELAWGVHAAGPPDRRHGGVDQVAEPRPGPPLLPLALHRRATSSSRSPATSTTPPSYARSRRRSRARRLPRPTTTVRPAPVRRGERARRTSSGQRAGDPALRAGQPGARRQRAGAHRRAPLRPRACSTPRSAAARPPGCSRRSASAAGWPTRSTPTPPLRRRRHVRGRRSAACPPR